MSAESEFPVSGDDVTTGDRGPEIVVEDLERADFVRYAGASGDFNPIHYDEPYAKAQGNPSVFGQGMLTAGIAAHMIADWFGIENVRTLSTRFTARVWPGDTVTTAGTITEVQHQNDSVFVSCEFTINTADEETVATGSASAKI